jgi:hypothetical protein
MSGSLGFRQYAENFLRFRSIEAEQVQSQDMRAVTFRASLVAQPTAARSNLAAVISTHRNRATGFRFSK